MTNAFHWPAARVIVTGGAGFLGRAIVASLNRRGAAHLFIPRSENFDLRTPQGCRALFDAFPNPTHIIHCAGTVGGLGLNRKHPARMFHDNLAMSLHLLDAARERSFLGPTGLHFTQVGTMTSYPATAPLPFREDDLWQGRPDPEIASYGLAKRATHQLLEAYRLEHNLRSAYVVPVNLYGPGDNIANPELSHVAGALVRKFVEAAAQNSPEVSNWGTGSPTRDFLYIDDAAEGVLRAAETITDATPVNIAGGIEVSIRTLAETIARLAGYQGKITWDASKGDGIARRTLDITRAKALMDWTPKVPLEEGLRRTIAWYRSTLSTPN